MDRNINQKTEEQSKKDGRKFLFYLVAFFITFATVDAFFVYKAITTSPGVVTENAYEIGLNYNEIIAKSREEQDEQSGSNPD
jgi:nitrogen fixation protein FixH